MDKGRKQKSKKILTGCEMLTSISDREGDIYEVFSKVPDEKTHLLIRSKDNRRIEEGKLFDYLSSQNIAGSYELKVRGDIRTKRKSRTAIIELRIAEVNLKKPKTLNKYDKYAGTVQVYAIGYSELEEGTSIIKLGMFALAASIKVMQLLLASKWDSNQAIEQVFNENEIKCLKETCKIYEGKTEKSKNRNSPGTLKWASWAIARIGGWKGYASQRPPGPITFFKGLHNFNLIYEGWCIAKKF